MNTKLVDDCCIDFIKENLWGLKLKTIAKKLNITEKKLNSILKKHNISVLEYTDYLTAGDLSESFNISKRKVLYWFNEKGLSLPKKRIYISRCNYYTSIDIFWKWAENNKTAVPWNNLEVNTFGIEPDWLKELRRDPLVLFREGKGFPWTNTIIDRLVLEFKRGKTLEELSILFNRKEPLLRKILLKEGVLIKKNSWKGWSTKELVELEKLVKCGLSNLEIAKTLDRTEASIKRKKVSSGIVPSFRKNKTWTILEEQLLVKLINSGSSIEYISKKMNRTKSSIHNKIQFLKRKNILDG